MNRSRKAVLLSALVYPGAGHWYLAKKWQSVALMAVATIALIVLMSGVVTQANLIADRVLSGEVQPELGTLINLLAEQKEANKSNTTTIATTTFGIVWVVGIIGAWLAGRAMPAKD